MLDKISDGRTDLVFEYLEEGHCADSVDKEGVSLIKWCAYYGDVSAIKYLLLRGESLSSLGENFGLNGAAFHGHWRLSRVLLERGADANHRLSDTGVTPLHAATKSNSRAHPTVAPVLISNGASPNPTTKPS